VLLLLLLLTLLLLLPLLAIIDLLGDSDIAEGDDEGDRSRRKTELDFFGDKDKEGNSQEEKAEAEDDPEAGGSKSMDNKEEDEDEEVKGLVSSFFLSITALLYRRLVFLSIEEMMRGGGEEDCGVIKKE